MILKVVGMEERGRKKSLKKNRDEKRERKK